MSTWSPRTQKKNSGAFRFKILCMFQDLSVGKYEYLYYYSIQYFLTQANIDVQFAVKSQKKCVLRREDRQ